MAPESRTAIEPENIVAADVGGQQVAAAGTQAVLEHLHKQRLGQVVRAAW
jgi:hypothetical protein